MMYVNLKKYGNKRDLDIEIDWIFTLRSGKSNYFSLANIW